MDLQPGYIYGLMGENSANHAKAMNKIEYVSDDNHFFEERTLRKI